MACAWQIWSVPVVALLANFAAALLVVRFDGRGQSIAGTIGGAESLSHMAGVVLAAGAFLAIGYLPSLRHAARDKNRDIGMLDFVCRISAVAILFLTLFFFDLSVMVDPMNGETFYADTASALATGVISGLVGFAVAFELVLRPNSKRTEPGA